MKIKSILLRENQEYRLEYSDLDNFVFLPLELCKQIYGVCFVSDKIIIAKNGKKNTWGLPGGTIEEGETIDQAFKREILEETNSEITTSLPIGYQKVIKPDNSYIYQLRSCCLVKRMGGFINDPGGSISEIKIIDPKDYKKYFDWREIGDRIMERALELREHLK